MDDRPVPDARQGAVKHAELESGKDQPFKITHIVHHELRNSTRSVYHARNRICGATSLQTLEQQGTPNGSRLFSWCTYVNNTTNRRLLTVEQGDRCPALLLVDNHPVWQSHTDRLKFVSTKTQQDCTQHETPLPQSSRKSLNPRQLRPSRRARRRARLRKCAPNDLCGFAAT